MLSAEFAANETWEDARKSLSILMTPQQHQKKDAIKQVKLFLAEECNVPVNQVHLFLSGRAGLFHVIKALESLKIDSEIPSEAVVTGFTCEAVVLPLKKNGIRISYADISDLDYSINPYSNRGVVSRESKYLLIQHTFGIPPQRDQLILQAERYGIEVIEDLAHGWKRGQFKDENQRSIKLFSFGRSKSLSSVFGGAVVSNSPELSKRLNDVESNLEEIDISVLTRLLLYKPYAMLVKSTYNWLGLGKLIHLTALKTGSIIPEISAKEKRGEYDPFFDKAYPNALAELLVVQIKRFKQTEELRRYSTQKYREALNRKIPDGLSLARFPVEVEHRDNLLKEAKKQGVYLGKWYTQPVAPAALDLTKVGYHRGDAPIAEKICDRIVNLPTTIPADQVEKIIAIVKPFVRKTA